MFRARILTISLLIVAVWAGLWILSSHHLSVRASAPLEPKSSVGESDFSDQTVSETVYEVIQSSGPEVEWTSRNPAAYRAREVRIDSGLLEASLETIREGDYLNFELFAGERMVAQVVKAQRWGRASATLALTARMSEHPESFVTLSTTGGILRAWIHDAAEGHDYQIRYLVSSQQHILLDVDTKGSEVYSCGNEDHDHEASPLSDGIEAGPSTGGNMEADLGTEATIVDVMVVYTDGALAVEGSLANMELNISEAFLKANLVHANSLTEVELNVVHTVEVDYQEDRSATNDLYALSRFDDVIDEIHYLREYAYFADFVSFFVDTESAGGLGFRPSSYDRIDYGYNLVRVQQSDTTSYTTVHELGHNMGNGHSKTQRRQAFSSGIAAYAAGWQWDDTSSPATDGYCSVMTYENFNSSGSDEYERVPHFSNPDVLYNGNPTGHLNDGNAAKVIRDGRSYYAAFLEPLSYPVQTELPYELSFEPGEDASLWQQFRSDSQDWDLSQSGETPSASTGPLGAMEGSYYAYVEASSHELDSALLTADFDFSDVSEPQISFYYHMDDGGSGQMGKLYYEVSTDGGLTWDRLFARSGDQGSDWNLAEVDLSGYAGQVVRMHFRVDVGSSYRSDIAIDRIRVEDLLADEPVVDFATWLAFNYPTISDVTPEGDPDLDGVVSFVEYALGRSPEVFESGGLPTAEMNMESGKLIFSFARSQEHVRYLVESVSNLNDWDDPDIEWDSWANPAPENLVNVGELQSVEIDLSGDSRFVRLNVSE